MFKELSEHKVSVKEAFNRAIDQNRFLYTLPPVDKEGYRGLDNGEDDPEAPLWGIYYRPENKTLAATWQLPAKGQIDNASPSATRKEVRSEVKELVGKAKLKNAVEKLIAIDEVNEEAITLSAALTRLERSERMNVIDSRDARVEWGRITYALLELAGHID